ncbi:MAG: OB-fold domain-containing protein [Deltaproteobacteria bacterium]|nr:OB-fold domain-containing protein [Deltaproteobacteria bacterium]MBW2420821.1 OB-fold domain-containing protein [Deltaproteobacteria bacterium]
MSGASPLPDVDWEPVREFWAAAARETLVIPRCSGCERYVWYPKPACPHCASQDMGWQEVSGRAALFSWAVVERALFAPFEDKAPYVTGLVALEEDPAVRLVTNIVDCSAQALRMDMPVCVVFRPLEFSGVEGSVTAPFFAPRG